MRTSEPTTIEEFFDLLDAVRDDGRYVPLAMGAHDRWEAATLGVPNIGPSYWKGEPGRLALIDGTAKLSDQACVDTLAALQRWSAYLPANASAVTYADAQQTFISGAAAIYPAGSWEIAGFAAAADFELGAFGPPPLAGQDTCYISDHADIGLGMNPATEHPEAARTFLAWIASSELAEIFSNALPGFFTLRDSQYCCGRGREPLTSVGGLEVLSLPSRWVIHRHVCVGKRLALGVRCRDPLQAMCSEGTS
ncbi:ABC transporter substrate-binding protein [Candidatus Poriferisodalis sp.]|uniref:ABC transporter substrate-binding protein n=1 Tax=Candidatus Poriferisodalis sp. TaxID=3101277 RepID=UPI003B5CF975